MHYLYFFMIKTTAKYKIHTIYYIFKELPYLLTKPALYFIIYT